ncbi:glycosyltransferase [Bremerella sp. JC770]|uniref:glycosyltransferase n=1 Tax=Bremerella sp. JC770 TaxID=3232137 RepID=UPI003459B8D4
MRTDGLKVLITNIQLVGRTGTEMYVHDLARALVRSGHSPVVYCPDQGPLAKELARNSVPVVDTLDKIRETPDIIHGHHTLQTLAAMLHFPKTPGIFLCHDFDAWHDTPPIMSRIRRYVAVDQTCADRLVLAEGVDRSQVTILTNPVDLQLFQSRTPLPEKPRKAIIFSSYGNRRSIRPIHRACDRLGIELDTVGRRLGGVCQEPHKRLPEYDLVFAKGRCAREALAVGCAVVYCDVFGMSFLVTSKEVRDLNQWGRRALSFPVTEQRLIQEIERYDAEDAAKVSAYIREHNSTDAIYDQLIEIYEEVIQQHQASDPCDHLEELRAMGKMAEWWHVTRNVVQPRPKSLPSRFVRSAKTWLAKKFRKQTLNPSDSSVRRAA